uniref:Uncharacterized protein n=1 Tax=Anopheles melas TaxID=34690 RepID=A0A182TZ74_9DIPT
MSRVARIPLVARGATKSRSMSTSPPICTVHGSAVQPTTRTSCGTGALLAPAMLAQLARQPVDADAPQPVALHALARPPPQDLHRERARLAGVVAVPALLPRTLDRAQEARKGRGEPPVLGDRVRPLPPNDRTGRAAAGLLPSSGSAAVVSSAGSAIVSRMSLNRSRRVRTRASPSPCGIDPETWLTSQAGLLLSSSEYVSST